MLFLPRLLGKHIQPILIGNRYNDPDGIQKHKM